MPERGAWPFRTFGVATVLLGMLWGGMVAANRETARMGGHDLSVFIVPAAVLSGVGLGMYFHQKWAVILFVFIAGSAGTWLAIGSVVSVPIPWSMLNVGVALGIFLWPCYELVKHWPRLDGQR